MWIWTDADGTQMIRTLSSMVRIVRIQQKVVRIREGQRKRWWKLRIESDRVRVNQKCYYKCGIHSFIVQAHLRLSENDKDL